MVDPLNGAGSYSFIWIYVVSPFAGGALAVLVSTVQHDAFAETATAPDEVQADAAEALQDA